VAAAVALLPLVAIAHATWRPAFYIGRRDRQVVDAERLAVVTPALLTPDS